MRTTWEKIFNHFGTFYGHDISNELQNEKRIEILQPEHTHQVKDKHLNRVERLRDQHLRLMQLRGVKLKLLEAEDQIQEYPEAPVKLAILINKIDEATYQETVEPAIKLDENEKTQNKNEWHTHHERVARLERKRGQVFSMVRGQWTQILMDKMKHDFNWDTARTRYDPLKFMDFIENTTLAETEYQYPFATVYEQEVAFYSYHQQNLTNNQWYERFNTNVDIRSAIGVTRQHKLLLEYVAQESNIKYNDMST